MEILSQLKIHQEVRYAKKIGLLNLSEMAVLNCFAPDNNEIFSFCDVGTESFEMSLLILSLNVIISY